MASIRGSVPGSGYGNVYVNSLIWGETAWDTASGPIRVWFGQSADFTQAHTVHGSSDVLTSGASALDWSAAEKAAFAYAQAVYESVCGLDFELADSAATADIVWWKTNLPDDSLGLHELPADPQVWGYFDPAKSSWNRMHFGGDGLNTVLHEIGHGLGLAHPHDGGDPWTGTTFPGVFDAFSIGDHGLNQGVWTIMSYNSGWAGAGYNLAYGNLRRELHDGHHR
jgi:serralysin